jgi:hypothetical protein
MTQRTALSWDVSDAVAYAQWYCSESPRNTAYCYQFNLNCANFLSQILTYGCQNLCEAPYPVSCGSAIDNDANCNQCDGYDTHRTILGAVNLRNHLSARTAYYQKVRNPNTPNVDYWTAPMNVPSWIGEGDIILFGNSTGLHRHSTFGGWGNGYSVGLYSNSDPSCGSYTLSTYWSRWGSGAPPPDGDYFDRFWIFHVIASPGTQEELTGTGETK